MHSFHGTRQTARRTTIALTLIAGSVLAACGGSDATGPGTGSTDTSHLSIVAATGTLPGLNGKTLSAAPGDTARLSGVINSSTSTSSTPASGLSWTVANAAVADVDATGLVRAKANGTTSIVARSSQYADTLTLVVSACGSAASVGLGAVGQVQSFTTGSTSSICFPSTTTGAEYAVVAYNADSADLLARGSDGQQSRVANIAVTGTGIATPASQLLDMAGASLTRGLSPVFSLGAASTEPERRRDASFDRGLRTIAERVLAPHMADAREARDARQATSSIRRSVAAAPVTVGQLMTLNAGLAPCDTLAADGLNRRVGRVVAISDKAIVVADTLNPANGFTTTEYQRYATAFDTLAYPVDVANFGEPYDVDNNGKSIIFFTSAVNAMTPASANYYVGGFFYERDLFPNNLSAKAGGCGASNYAEMFYMLVPDPTGQVNNNKFSKTFVDGVTIGTLAHEFQHLINADRRLYVNSVNFWEDQWLNEGLSHIAEELTFYHASGTAPRARLDATGIRATTNVLAAYNAYQKGNLDRLLTFLPASESTSPYADNDQLATRGATWEFLRYAADRLNGVDATLWKKLVSSTKSFGMSNLQTALGLSSSTMADWLNDWTIANYADGVVTPADTRYTYRSWDTRSIVGSLKSTQTGQPAYPLYPIVSHAMTNGVSQSAAVRGGAAAYFRIAVAANTQARVAANGASGAALPATVRLSVVRTK